MSCGSRAADGSGLVADALGAADVMLKNGSSSHAGRSSSRRALPPIVCTARRRGVHPHDDPSTATASRSSRVPTDRPEAVAAPVFDDGRSGPSRRCSDAATGRCRRDVPPALADAAARQARNGPRRGRRKAGAPGWRSLTVLCGDFNENAAAPACRGLEARGWTNCAAAAATQALDGGTGGTTFLGTTHRAHTGDALSCDHIFATDRTEGGQRSSGCFDAAGARLVAARRVADAWDPTLSTRTTRRRRGFRSASRISAGGRDGPSCRPGRTVSRERPPARRPGLFI